MNSIKTKKCLEQFLLEDIGEQDTTSTYLFTDSDQATAQFVAKSEGILAGVDLIKQAYQLFNSKIEVTTLKEDGDPLKTGDVLARVSGKASDILTGERVILNLVQRMSGIATMTHHAVQCLQNSHTKILDTRKTTPGLRIFEKYAVRCGGGVNHRYGLYDGIMLKDNHIAYAGSITKAVARIREQIGHMIKIEVEIETKEQLLEAIEAKADIIMFDNCSPETIKEWILLVPDTIQTEASGGIELEDIKAYGETGVQFISLGFLTHSVKSLDISLDLKIERKEE